MVTERKTIKTGMREAAEFVAFFPLLPHIYLALTLAFWPLSQPRSSIALAEEGANF